MLNVDGMGNKKSRCQILTRRLTHEVNVANFLGKTILQELHRKSLLRKIAVIESYGSLKIQGSKNVHPNVSKTWYHDNSKGPNPPWNVAFQGE